MLSKPWNHRDCAAYLERTQQALVHTHHCPRIVEFSTVVGCTEQCDQLSLGEELVAILNHLMRATDEIHVMFLQETRDDVGPEREGHAAIIFAPASDVFVRVGPQQVAEKSAVRDLERSVPRWKRDSTSDGTKNDWSMASFSV